MNESTAVHAPEKKSRRTLLKLVCLVGVLCLGAAMIIGGVVKASQPAETSSAPMPEHTFAADSPDTYTGPTVKPTWKPEVTNADQVLIEALQLQAPLVQTGAEDGYLTLPKPPKATWYEQTVPLDAKAGRTLIASHVDSGYGDKAPFSRLHKIEKGTPIEVDRDGKTYRFKAVSIAVYKQQALPQDLFRLTGSHQLVLVTCSGPTVNAGQASHYAYNLVVIAEPV